MQKRHQDRKQYFDEQAYSTQKYVIPFIEECLPIASSTRVLEIGCGEGGNLKPFLDLGCEAIGVDLNEAQINRGKSFYAGHPHEARLQLIYKDIYEVEEEELGQFDLILMRDVIEHIHNQEKFMHFVKRFLRPEGKFFLGFPPWNMPFGGHQQICKSNLLSKAPYYHLLPSFAYRKVLEAFGETQKTVDDLLEIKETGISIERFDRILKTEAYTIDKKILYFINPNYEIKFNLKPRRQIGLVSQIPYLRNFVTTCCYYLISYPTS